MLQPKKAWGVVWLSLMIAWTNGVPVQQSCECGLFIRDSLRRPNQLVMTLENNLHLDCSNTGAALKQCKDYCGDEVSLPFVFGSMRGELSQAKVSYN